MLRTGSIGTSRPISMCLAVSVAVTGCVVTALVATVVVTAALVGSTVPAAAQPAATAAGIMEGGAAAGRIVVTGVGDVEREPDFARVFVTVTNRAETVAEAIAANRAATDAALAAIEARGVARDDVRTSNFQVFETPEVFGTSVNGDRDADRRLPAFTATHQLEIVLRTIDAVGAFAGDISSVDGLTFESIGWGLERSDEAQAEAMRRAVADARRQAEILAEAAGISLGEILRIGEPGGGVRPMPENGFAMRAMAAPSVPIVPPATLTFSASVGMEWAIAP